MRHSYDFVGIVMACFFGLMVLLTACIVGAHVYERVSCKNGENIPTNSGAMDCFGGEAYKHCEPETKWVCHDKE